MRGRPRIRFFRALVRDLCECGSRLSATTGSGSQSLVIRHSSFARTLFTQIVSVVLVVALFLATTVEVKAAPTYSPVFYYYHSDHLGGSNILTDRCGELVDHFEYTAFGKERYNESSGAFAVSNRFTGQILDEDTGLYYYGARYYDPELGRFTQADTVVPSAGDPQMLNRYSYAGNNPLKYVDPSGHFIELAIAAVIGTLAVIATAATYAATALFVLGIANLVTGNNYGSRIFGNDVGQWVDTAAAVSTVIALAAVAAVLQPDAIPFIIASGVLSIGPIAAGAAGNPELAEALGWAALGVAVAGTAYELYQSYESVNSAIQGENAGVKSNATTLPDRKQPGPWVRAGESDERLLGSKEDYKALLRDTIVKRQQIVYHRFAGHGAGGDIYFSADSHLTSELNSARGWDAELQLLVKKAYHPRARIELGICDALSDSRVGYSAGANFKAILPQAKVTGGSGAVRAFPGSHGMLYKFNLGKWSTWRTMDTVTLP
jgi:RHS repeat-associated protein